jgi:hypothetical protein
MTFSLGILPIITSLFLHPVATTTMWETDYNKAKQIALETHKPMVVVVGEGKDGWNKLSPETSFDGTIEKMLTKGFVCVYVDSSTNTGKALADALDVHTNTGLVISDKSTKLQAFSKEGTVSTVDLVNVIARYTEAATPVTTTETLTPALVAVGAITPVRMVVSPVTTIAPVAVSPVVTAPMMVSPVYNPVPILVPAPSSCPNGQCPNARPTVYYIR